MAQILNDTELKKLIGTVIKNGDENCIRPNSYILRLGPTGEFLNTGKEFELGKNKKGIRIQPGHAVGLTALEVLDFSREIVHSIFPENDLHGLLSPTTDLSREGIVTSTTQIDAGYKGTLNWTLTNTSSEERKFVQSEKIFRLTIFKLGKNEIPENLYCGDYQDKVGYLRSNRAGAPVGMKDSEWEDAFVKGGPQELLDNLIKSGYPWNILGKKLQEIDNQFITVTDEYSKIHHDISTINKNIDIISQNQKNTPQTVQEILRSETQTLQNRWLIGVASIILAISGIILPMVSNEKVASFFKEFGVPIGFGLIIISGVTLYVISKKK
ncbi:MAG: hypothetical protein HQ541_14920 [Mariniphaga sp.]|nr:hypothetical protein [Mariniphaga sp.]